MSNPSAIPPEILQDREACLPEILKRVPVSQLGICSCVSKKWYTLITSSAFISSHTKTQTHLQSSKLFFIRSVSDKNPLKKHKELYHFCSFSQFPPKQTLETLIKKTIPCPLKTVEGLQFRVVGSLNGVVLLSDDYYALTEEFFLWNPLVYCYIHLPKPRACFDAVGMCMDALGFGYDDVNDDFKVVRLVYQQLPLSDYSCVDKVPPLAEVYSVKEGEWRWVNSSYIEYCTVDIEWSQCFLKGNVHWVAYEMDGGCHKSSILLLFNVEKENFLVMKLPLELRDVCPLSLVVSECQGLLCLHHYLNTEINDDDDHGLKHGGYNLWVKKEYNKAASWIKVASVDFKASIVPKDIYWRRNGELPYLNKDSEFVSFYPETNIMVVLESGCRVHYEAWSFIGSLAFLNKDCKNKRTVRPEEVENGSNDDEEVTPDDLDFFKMSKHVCTSNQMKKFNRRF